MLKQLPAIIILAACGCNLVAQSNTDRTTYHTDGHIKSNGINLTIKYPSDWTPKEGERPHIVQKFVSPDRYATVMIIIKDLALPSGTSISQKELTEFFEPNELKNFLPEGSHLIVAQKTKIDGLPAGILEYKLTGERLGNILYGHTLLLVFIYKKTVIQLFFGVLSGSGEVESSQLMQHYKPIFMQIANSVVLPDIYRESTTAPRGSPRKTPKVRQYRRK